MHAVLKANLTSRMWYSNKATLHLSSDHSLGECCQLKPSSHLDSLVGSREQKDTVKVLIHSTISVLGNKWMSWFGLYLFQTTIIYCFTVTYTYMYILCTLIILSSLISTPPEFLLFFFSNKCPSNHHGECVSHYI